MREESYYLDSKKCKYFVHEHEPDKIKEKPFIFLNPIFDEKKRSQRFYAETARFFCKRGIPVIRFDYYGTGDSGGQLYELEFESILDFTSKLFEIQKQKYKVENINLFGLRFGADLAIKLSEKFPIAINNLLLIEPIVDGNRYLLEQRTRRKIFQKVHNMNHVNDFFVLNNKKFEDFQGFPVSSSFIKNLMTIKPENNTIQNKNITLIKLNNVASVKRINELHKKLLNLDNKINYHTFSIKEFWASLDFINTQELSMNLCNYLQ
jgi:hypothetical protein